MKRDHHITRLRRPPLAPGTQMGRWTILRPATPGQLNGWMRRRHLARCVCGRTQLVFEHYLRHGRSRGCPSAACRHAWEAKRRDSGRSAVYDHNDVDHALDESEEFEHERTIRSHGHNPAHLTRGRRGRLHRRAEPR